MVEKRCIEPALTPNRVADPRFDRESDRRRRKTWMLHWSVIEVHYCGPPQGHHVTRKSGTLNELMNLAVERAAVTSFSDKCNNVSISVAYHTAILLEYPWCTRYSRVVFSTRATLMLNTSRCRCSSHVVISASKNAQGFDREHVLSGRLICLVSHEDNLRLQKRRFERQGTCQIPNCASVLVADGTIIATTAQAETLPQH